MNKFMTMVACRENLYPNKIFLNKILLKHLRTFTSAFVLLH